jgi:hypothetical protein
MIGVAGLADVNYGTAEVPARTAYVEQETTDTIGTTNKRDVPDGHAEGTVIIANKTSIPVTVTKGTVVRTSFGENVRFYTVADVWLPGELHRTARVGIIAAEPGPNGNVAPLVVSVIEGALAAQVDVLNDARTEGGTVRRISTVDGEDKVQLRAKLMRRIQEEAYTELISTLDEGEFIPPDSLVVTVAEESFTHKVGDITDQLGMTMKVRASGLAVNSAEGEQLLMRLLEQQMKQGYRLVDDGADFTRGGVSHATPERASFEMSVRAAMAPAVEAVEVKSAVAGKTVDQAKDLLSRQFKLNSQPQIDLHGSPLGRLPWWTVRTRVQVTTE